MKLINKFLGFGIACGALFGFVACTNELSEQPNVNGGLGGIRLAKSADITAWSGNQFLSPGTPIIANTPLPISYVTRDGEQTQQGEKPDQWDFTEVENHDHEDWYEKFNFKTLEELKTLKDKGEAADVTESGFNKDVKIFYVPDSFSGNLDLQGLGFDNDDEFYNFGEITKLENVNYNGLITIYNDGIWKDFSPPSGGKHTVYNTGDLTVVGYSNIGALYNNGDLTLEREHSQYYENIGGTAEIKSDVSIFSLKDIEMPDGGYFEGNADIHGIIYSNKNIEFRNTNTRYVCGIIVKDGDTLGNVHIVKGTLKTGYIIANEISFDGEHIWLLEDAYINAQIMKLPNSNTAVHCYKGSNTFIKTKDIIFENKNNFVDTFSEGIYFSVTGTLSIQFEKSTGGGGYETKEYKNIVEYLTSEEGQDAIPRFNYSLSGQAECGDEWKTTDEDIIPGLPNSPEPDPCPKATDDTEDDGCGHDGKYHDKETGICRECEKDDIHSVCNPCPLEEEGKDCGHAGSKHGDDGICDECVEEGTTGPCNPEDSSGNPTTPSTPAKGSPKSEVEVNLSINDEHTMQGLKDLVAKLSIHIRHSEDVEIFIPVGAEHYVANDDLIILKDHQLGNFEHGGEFDDEATLTTQFVTYEINGYSVTLTVQFEPSGIKVTTSGMRKEIFDYLKTEFGDGLNFEVWLYFNDASEDYGRTQLQSDLNRSTIEFLGDSENKYPDYYINAFNHTADNQRGEKDCTVSIVDGQKSQYGNATEDFHLNGSKYNKIYKNKEFKDGPEGVHDHHFLWDYYNPNTNNSGNQENPAQ